MIDYVMSNDYLVPTLFAVCWFGAGIYGALANIERVKRVWGFLPPSRGRKIGDEFQHALTLFLGPIGVAMVMSSGGRNKFWRKAEK